MREVFECYICDHDNDGTCDWSLYHGATAEANAHDLVINCDTGQHVLETFITAVMNHIKEFSQDKHNENYICEPCWKRVRSILKYMNKVELNRRE